MIELRLGEKVYKLPQEWSEVSVKQYIEIQNVISQELSNVEQIIEFISVLSSCPKAILLTASLDDLSQLDFNWLLKPVKPSIKKIIEIDGVRYGVIKDMKHLTLGEYVDIDNYTKQPNENLHLICAVLMRPVIDENGELYIIEKYDSQKVETRANLFLEKMNVCQLVGLTNFFTSSASGYVESLSRSLPKKKAKKKAKKK